MPAASIQAKLLRPPAGTRVMVRGNVIVISSSAMRETPAPPPANGRSGPSTGRSAYAAARPVSTERSAATDCRRSAARKLARPSYAAPGR